MDWQSYERTRRYGEAKEAAKRPGQNFCDQVGYRLSSKYEEIQRPDRITMIGGTIVRTITPTTHCWYKNRENGEHIWIEFSSNGVIEVKKGIRVTRSPGLGFNQEFLHPNSDSYEERRTFSSNGAAADYLLGL